MDSVVFYKIMHIDIPTTSLHNTLGMVLTTTPHTGRLQLTDMEKGTPGAKLPRWRSTLKRAVLLSVNGKRVGSVQDVISAITQSRQVGDIKVQCTFAMISYHGLHPVTGNMMLYYNQLNVIAQHLQVEYTKQGDSACIPPAPNIRQVQAQTNSPNPEDLGKTYTLKELRKR
jgi:hypothetical protein